MIIATEMDSGRDQQKNHACKNLLIRISADWKELLLKAVRSTHDDSSERNQVRQDSMFIICCELIPFFICLFVAECEIISGFYVARPCRSTGKRTQTPL